VVCSGVYEESVSWICPTPAPPGECLEYGDFPPLHENELPTFPGISRKCLRKNISDDFALKLLLPKQTLSLQITRLW